MQYITARQLTQYFLSVSFILIFVYLLVDYSVWNIWSIPIFFLALYVADVFTGFVHIYFDYRPCVSGVGLRELFFYKGSKGSDEYIKMRRKTMTKISAFQELTFDFKIHHPSPDTLGRRGFVKLTVGGIVFGGLPASLLLLLLAQLNLLNQYFILFSLIFIAAMVISQYTHSCAHKKKIPYIPNILQKIRFFVSPERHDVHHQTLNRDFCILNGWSNPLVNMIFDYCEKKSWVDMSGLEPD
ncbi:MAG: carotenoid synthesis regulator CarF [Saccharospirillaceae bacterium]|nr:fatty acid desaturase family protein [Pseudomonadales bacterium]NRB77951.1 carotenoid synthesis regulator CarF [Saccharospirillaceae bacterium]